MDHKKDLKREILQLNQEEKTKAIQEFIEKIEADMLDPTIPDEFKVFFGNLKANIATLNN